MLNTTIYSIIQGQSTALHHAAYWGQTDSVALLATSGANLNMQDEVS